MFTLVAHGRNLALPTLPWATPVPELDPGLAALISAAAQPNTTATELVRMVSEHPRLAVEILHVVNRSIRNRGSPIASIHKALRHLGGHGLRSLALVAAATSGMRPEELYPFDIHRFWEDSLRRAVACQELAERRIFGEHDPQRAFAAGLLQDLPVLILIRRSPTKADLWMKQAGDEPERRRREERKLFGVSHDELASDLARSWKLCDDIAIPMGYHHRPERAPGALQNLCRLHELAESLASIMSANDTAFAWREALKRFARVLDDEPQELVDDIVGQMGPRVMMVARSMGMDVPSQPTLERLKDRAERINQMDDLSRPDLVAQLKQMIARNDSLTRELMQCRAELSGISAIDELTGLPNERALEGQLQRDIQRAARSGQGLAVMRIKIVPERDDVDLVLAQQAGGVALGATMRTTALVARTSECQFEVLLPDTRIDAALTALDRAIDRLDGASRQNGGGWGIRCGIAGVDGCSHSREQTDTMPQRLRLRALVNAAASQTEQQPFVRTGKENVEW